jgi:hypothetical protein
MTELPPYLLRQIYYFLLERPEINKKSNIEKIQAFFFEVGLSFTIHDRYKIQITHGHDHQAFRVSTHELPNFLDEKYFIPWVLTIIKPQQAA